MQQQEELINKIDSLDIMESISEGNITLSEVVDSTMDKISNITLGELSENKINPNKLLTKVGALSKMKNISEEVAEYYSVYNNSKNTNEGVIEYNDKSYFKYNENLYKIKKQIGTTYITYNILNNKYTIFSHNGTETMPLLIDIENIEPTNIDNWWKVHEKTERSGWIPYKVDGRRNIKIGGYYFIGDNGKTQYLEGGSNFSDLDFHGNLVYFHSNKNIIDESIRLSEGENDDFIESGYEAKKILKNGRNLLLISHDLGTYFQKQSLYDMDNMELLIDKALSLSINKEENTVIYIEEEDRIFEWIEKLGGKKKVKKQMDLNEK